MQLVLTNSRKTKLLTAIFLIIIAIISILPRIKYIDKTPYINNIGHIYTITTINTWNKEGISKHYFSPVLTNTHKADKNIYEYKRLTDKEGNNYFVSFPAFSFITAYVFSKIFYFIEINYLLSGLAILSQCITAFLIFLIIKKITAPQSFVNYIPAITSFSIVMFFTPFLFHSLSWFPEVCILPIWAFFIFCIINIKYQNKINFITSVIIALIGLLLGYTDWLGYLIIFSFSIYIIFLNKNKVLKKTGILLIVGGLMALVLTIVQYSAIDEVNSLIRAWGLRFAERSGLFSQSLSDQGINWLSIKTLNLSIIRFRELMSGVGYLSIFLILLSVFISKHKLGEKKDLILIYLALFPVVFHFIILLNSNIIHIGGWAKVSIPLAIFASLFINTFIKNEYLPKNYLITGILAGFILSVIVSLSNFNKIFDSYPSNKIFDTEIDIIKQNTLYDEVVIIKHNSQYSFYLPFIEFSTGRNICTAKDEAEAKAKLKKSGQAKGKYFDFKIYNQKIKANIKLLSNIKYED